MPLFSSKLQLHPLPEKDAPFSLCNSSLTLSSFLKMLSSLPSSSSPAVHFNLSRPSSRHHRPAAKTPIFTIPLPRPRSAVRLATKYMASSCGDRMTELTRFTALGAGLAEAPEEADAEAVLAQGPAAFVPGFSWSDVDWALNRMSKWLVAALFAVAILFKHDAEVLWIAMGSVLNSWMSITLKRILNHDRPVHGLRSDPGMPSSHAQSIFYAEAFGLLFLFHSMGINLWTVTVGGISLMFGSYLTWLRVSHHLHTCSQVVVGGALGSACGAAWFWLWHSFVLRAFVSSVWVRVMVVLGSATFCVSFVIHAVRHWLREEP